MPSNNNLTPASGPPSIATALIEEARQAGLLNDKTKHVSFRAPKALIDAAKRETGAQSTTELGLVALATLARTRLRPLCGAPAARSDPRTGLSIDLAALLRRCKPDLDCHRIIALTYRRNNPSIHGRICWRQSKALKHRFHRFHRLRHGSN